MWLRAILDQLHVLIDRKTAVTFSELPEELQYDFQKFVYGNTLTLNKDGQHAVYYTDFKKWYLKIKYKGFELRPDAVS